MAYIGVSPSNGVRRVHTYTATASQTTFSGAGAEGTSLSYKDSNYVDVYQNGVKLGDADYTATSGTSIVLGTGATASDLVVIVVFDVFSVADTVSKADGGTFDGNVTFSGEIITSTSGTSNVRVGENAGDAIASGGNYNVVIGDEAGTALTTGDNNVAIGFEALNTEDANGLNVAVGFRSLKTLNAGADAENVAVGNNTGLSMTTAVYNTVIGSQSGDALTDGSANTAVGYNTLSADTRGQNSTAVGRNALLAQNFTSSTDSYNVAMGRDAGLAITTGVQNTFIGSLAGDALTVGDNNVAIGYNALTADTKGERSVAIGVSALASQNFTSATESKNTAIGMFCLDTLSTGTNNTAIGYNSGGDVTTGVNNTLIGSGTGDGITTGDRNTAVGYFALGGNIDDGQYNTCIGADAGLVTTGDQNTFVGAYDPSTGGSGAEVTTGGKNTILGSFNGNQSNLDIRTSSNNIVISDGDGFPDFYKTMTVGTNGTWFTGNRTATAYWPHTSTGNALNGISLQGETGTVGITSNSLPLYINRNTDDGGLIYFYATGNNEGNISVSGTTVSYNGGHLSRWSQLSDGSKDTTIVKGTVMTNLDQMAVWKHEAVKVGDDEYSETGQLIGKATEAKDAYTEDNEQLNCMAVSNVEGDVNVAGVFVNWDYIDDGFNDMNIAMTGDMVIRIAKGTKVARGDLLMSAGDGTAKPQGDDIVRSKTIAKVTSTNVSHTYDDGTYLVPCVLMAC